MDPEPALLSNSNKLSLRPPKGNKKLLPEQETFLAMNEPSVAFLGLTIAIATVAVPLIAVMTVRPFEGRTNLTTSVKESNGSKQPIPLSISRFSKPGG